MNQAGAISAIGADCVPILRETGPAARTCSFITNARKLIAPAVLLAGFASKSRSRVWPSRQVQAGSVASACGNPLTESAAATA